jgi:hypothetical protein
VAGGTVTLNPLGFVETPGTTWVGPPPADPAPQLGSPHRIDAGDDRMLGVVLRRGCLWFSHTAFLPTNGPVRSVAQWLQVRVGGASVLQLGRLGGAEADSFVAFPTIAVNADEDALIGFAHFTPNQHGSGGYAFRAAADTPGSLRSIVLYADGQSPYFKTFTGAKNRWGDYSATQVDPGDDRGFWTVQELAAAVPDTWATRWANVT